MKKIYSLFLVLIFASFAANNVSAQGLTSSFKGKLMPQSKSPDIVNGVLYSQLDSATTVGTASQQFPDFGNGIIETADEFTVPAGKTWGLDSIDVIGQWSAAGPMVSIKVIIYNDSANVGIRPGTQVAIDSSIIPLTALTVASATFKLHNIISLPAGKYWMSVVILAPFATNGQWYWTTRPTRGAPCILRDRNNLLAGGTQWRVTTTAPNQAVAFRLRGTETSAPPPGSNVLVITNDSTTPTAQRIADRDTLKKYVAQLVGGTVTYMTKNTTTVFPDLSSYNTIIFQETSFDATAVRSLVAAQRTALMTWLGTGTPSAKKSLIMIGADLGYAYDQAAVAQTDTVFSRSFGGFQYMLDNGAATAPLANVGLNPPGTQYDVMNIGTTSYWPDGCKPISGGVTFNLYKTRVDTVAGVYKINPNWNVVSTFQDPRYFTGAGDGSGETGFKRVLRNMINIVRNNGGVITNVTPLVGIVAEKYSLAQNYPNPFNPTTKINFTIPNNGLVTLKIYDMLGKEVASLVNGQLTQGSYSVDFNASKLSSGIYFYTIQSGNFVDTKKMMLIK